MSACLSPSDMFCPFTRGGKRMNKTLESMTPCRDPRTGMFFRRSGTAGIVPRIDVAQDDAGIEEQRGIRTEVMKAAVVETAEGEDGVDLLVGRQTPAQRVEQRERNVVRPGADVIRVIQGAREDVAEDAA